MNQSMFNTDAIAKSNQAAMERLLAESPGPVVPVVREMFSTARGVPSFLKTAMRLHPPPPPAKPKASRFRTASAQWISKLRNLLARIEKWLVPNSPAPDQTALFIPPYVRKWRTDSDRPTSLDSHLMLGLWPSKAELVCHEYRDQWCTPETWHSLNPTPAETPLFWIPIRELVTDDWYSTGYRLQSLNTTDSYLGTADCKTFVFLRHNGQKFVNADTDEVFDGLYHYWTRLPEGFVPATPEATVESPQEPANAIL